MRIAPATTVIATAGAVVLAGCSPRQTATTPTTTNDIAVVADETRCDLARDNAVTGDVTFRVTNGGQAVTEFYLYGPGDQVLGEVENIAPGQIRQLAVAISESGTYAVSCRPGMTGAGIRHAFFVTRAHRTGNVSVTPP